MRSPNPNLPLNPSSCSPALYFDCCLGNCNRSEQSFFLVDERGPYLGLHYCCVLALISGASHRAVRSSVSVMWVAFARLTCLWVLGLCGDNKEPPGTKPLIGFGKGFWFVRCWDGGFEEDHTGLAPCCHSDSRDSYVLYPFDRFWLRWKLGILQALRLGFMGWEWLLSLSGRA